MEMTRCMLYEKELPKKLWAEAASTAVFLLNRLPSRVLNKKTLFEGWFGYKPDLQNLKIFGCLMYLTVIRPDIMFTVSMLSRFMHCASEVHLQAVKRIVRYVKGTIDYGVKYTHSQNFQFHGYSDSDWGGSIDDMKSTTGYSFSFGSGMFSWSSKKQDIVAQSIAEAEYVAATAVVNQAIWLRRILADLHMEQKEPTQILVDDQASIFISNNPIFHGRTKHFKIKFFFKGSTERR